MVWFFIGRTVLQQKYLFYTMTKNNKSKRLLQSTIVYDKKIAKNFSKTAYHEAQAKNMAMYEFIEQEKLRLSTPKWSYVTNLLTFYKDLGDLGWESPTGLRLQGIFKKNSQAAKDNISVTNSHLIEILGKPETLLLAYKMIKGNKGALTEAATLGSQTINSLTQEQLELYYNSQIFPHGFGLRDVLLASQLLQKGLYPWGASRRVYVPKPGIIDKKRPITIPPFMDKVVQKAISMILEAVYEPYFEKQNRSFGFRPNKGVHDAIVTATSNYSSGKITAIEGGIEIAYDTVNRKRLIEILNKKITDRKFLNVIKDRLKYEYIETNEKGVESRLKSTSGVPQGGIDTPYLFNIYMKELDDFVHTEIQSYLDFLNEKYVKPTKETSLGIKTTTKVARTLRREYNKHRADMEKVRRHQKKTKALLKIEKNPEKIQDLRKKLFAQIKTRRLITHYKNHLSSTDPSQKKLLLLYIRYADDWLILINGSIEIAKKLKDLIADFLINNLSLRLSIKKTVITDIRKEPARFLGYQLRHPLRGPLIKEPTKDPFSYKSSNLQRKKGSTIIWASPDSQKLINRLHMKGFCDKKGFPQELPWLSCFEDHVIIERYNSVIRGFAEFYLGSIRNAAAISRWIYIMRYSCFKTLAQKYRTNISGIFKKFGVKLTDKSRKTIQVSVEIMVKDKIMTKDWTLWTYKDLLKVVKAKTRWSRLQDNFWEIEKGKKIGLYPLKVGKLPVITNDKYLEQISWTSLRTQASFSMPCANENCGSIENVQQHHVKHIRKQAYSLISGELPYKKVMALRNRKQIPLCAHCHRHLVHGGKFHGPSLVKLTPTKLIDNRVLHVERYVKTGTEYFAKTLKEKGWIEKPQIK